MSDDSLSSPHPSGPTNKQCIKKSCKCNGANIVGNNMHKNYYKHIDGLRALAVVSVFLCHLEFVRFSGGFVGVDVFFVISGFLITNIIIQQLDSPAGFSFLKKILEIDKAA